MTTWETAKAADGPGLVAWLRERGVEDVELGASGARTLLRWASGRYADFFAVDAMLTRLGLHAMDVPEELWHARARPPIPRCVHGHALTRDNVYVNAVGHRRCRKCMRPAKAAYKRRKREAGAIPRALKA